MDLRDLLAVDLGSIADPDGPEGESRTAAAVEFWPGRLLDALGGYNSITYAVATGVHATGLVTLDAHHDLRDGTSNGSPVQRLLTDDLDGRRVVQIGSSDFANSPQYAARARDRGIMIVHRDEVESRGIGVVPGGLSAYQLQQAARAADADPRVVSIDLAEVDASSDGADGRTVRLVAV